MVRSAGVRSAPLSGSVPSGSWASRICSSASATQNFSKAHVTKNAVIRASLWVAVTSTVRRCVMVERSTTWT